MALNLFVFIVFLFSSISCWSSQWDLRLGVGSHQETLVLRNGTGAGQTFTANYLSAVPSIHYSYDIGVNTLIDFSFSIPVSKLEIPPPSGSASIANYSVENQFWVQFMPAMTIYWKSESQNAYLGVGLPLMLTLFDYPGLPAGYLFDKSRVEIGGYFEALFRFDSYLFGPRIGFVQNPHLLYWDLSVGTNF